MHTNLYKHGIYSFFLVSLCLWRCEKNIWSVSGEGMCVKMQLIVCNLRTVDEYCIGAEECY